MEESSEADGAEIFAAGDLYDLVTFKSPTDFYNREAPAPYVAFIIGAALSLVTAVYWYALRWRPHTIKRRNLTNTSPIEDEKHGIFFTAVMLIATISDNDDPNFTMLRLASQSMIFLGGFQLHYQFTYVVMLLYYSIISLSDTLRVLISISDSESLHDLVKISRRDRSNLKSSLNLSVHNSGTAYVELKGGNVYEDLTKPYTVVALVFITQAILISLIGVDIHNSSTHTTLDRTPNVPVVGTLGSYLIYILGILMQSVYILGPKMNFGTSEQNPHYWIKLFLAVKQTGATCSWFDPLDDRQKEFSLQHNDVRIWVPFIMSFLINGVGFHILVHALPIQVAAQSSLAGVVIRAVGMMYLVDLDDAPGTVIKIFEKRVNNNAATPKLAAINESSSEDDSVLLKVVKKQLTEETTPPLSEESPRSIILSSTPEEVIERARRDAEEIQIQLQKDLDALAQIAMEKSKKKPIDDIEGHTDE